MGLASDDKDIYFSIDAGSVLTDVNNYSSPTPGRSHPDILSNSAVRVSLNDSGIQLMDFFRPYDYQSNAGLDIGSSGISLLNPTAFHTSTAARIGISTGRHSNMYVLDLDNLGGYRTGTNGTNSVLQTVRLPGGIFGGVGSYHLENGYLYVNPGNSPLMAYRWSPSLDSSNSSTPLLEIAGTSSTSNLHRIGVGIPTVTSFNEQTGSGIVWITDVERGLLAYKAVPVNDTLIEIALPKVEGALRFGRPVFGDGKVYVVDGKDRLVALGAGGR